MACHRLTRRPAGSFFKLAAKLVRYVDTRVPAPDSVTALNGVVATPLNLLLKGVEGEKRIFRTDTKAEQRGWRVVGAGFERIPSGCYVQRRDFPYHAVEFIAAGRGLLELAGTRSTLAGGCIYVTAQKDRLSLRADSKRAVARYYLWLEGSKAEFVCNQAGLSGSRVRSLAVPGEIREAWEWLLREGSHVGEQGADLAQKLAEVLLLKIAVNCKASSSEIKTKSRESFERCRALADGQAERLKGAAALAAAAGLRTETVCRQFQRYLGKTPGDYLRAKKVELAADRLRKPGVRVKEVAAAMGFSDAFHFSRVFKKELGVSPKTWRARLNREER